LLTGIPSFFILIFETFCSLSDKLYYISQGETIMSLIQLNKPKVFNPVETTHPITLKGVFKDYPTPAGNFTALRNIDLDIQSGEFVAVIGKSGSGKSTLLNLLAGIDRPTSGDIFVNGTEINTLSENQISVWRGRNIGVVFQFFQLLPTLTVQENILLSMDFCGVIPTQEREGRAHGLLEMVGVADQAEKLPSALSGGEQQRAAIARALANNPPVLVADEPTGNLDSFNSDLVLELFQKLARSGKTVLMVTHERDINQIVTRSIRLADGQIVE
jgi:putative ABC transport system ATP-binding protein